MSSESTTIILLASDLMLCSTVSGFAASVSLPFRNCGTIADVADTTLQRSDVLLMVDLGLPGLDIATLANAVPATILATAIAYGPHVHTAKLQAAEDAGFGRVMSRGQFSAQVGQLIGAAKRG